MPRRMPRLVDRRADSRRYLWQLSPPQDRADAPRPIGTVGRASWVGHRRRIAARPRQTRPRGRGEKTPFRANALFHKPLPVLRRRGANPRRPSGPVFFGQQWATTPPRPTIWPACSLGCATACGRRAPLLEGRAAAVHLLDGNVFQTSGASPNLTTPISAPPVACAGECARRCRLRGCK